MENMISWFEIPANDFDRAVNFYKTIFNIRIDEMEMEGQRLGIFPMDGKNVSGAIVEAGESTPSSTGVLVYLNGGADLQNIVDKIGSANGKLLTPKTQISPEMGYFAIFMDTEGNKLGLHSMQ